MTEFRSFIYNKMKEYSSILSTSGNEEELCRFVMKDFETEDSNVESRLVYKNNSLFYYFLQLDKKSNFFFTVHLDRVRSYTNTIKDYSEEALTGQLDNSISIAVLRYLLSKGLKFNVLFTTVEEICESWVQLQEIMTLYRHLIPISVDIDVVSDQIMRSGKISLRLGDSIGPYNEKLVGFLRGIANSKNISYIDEKEGWTAVEPGFLFRGCELEGAHVGLPLIKYQTDNEEMSWETIESAANFIQLLLENQKNFNSLDVEDTKHIINNKKE